MDGFIQKIRDWFSDENVLRNQERLESWWKSRQGREKGWLELIKSAPKLVLKVFGLVLLGIVLVVVLRLILRDSAWALALAAAPVTLIVLNYLKPGPQTATAAVISLVAIGGIGIGAFVLNICNVEIYLEDPLYWALVVVGIVATYVFDKRATIIMGVFVVLALVVDAVIHLPGAAVEWIAGDLPLDGINHVTWMVLGSVAVGVAWTIARKGAAVVLTIVFCAAGIREFVFGYAGWHLPPWAPTGPFGPLLSFEQLSYGLLFVAVAAVVFLSRPRSRKPEADPAVVELGRQILEKLYEEDKKHRIITTDGERFLAKVLQRSGITQEQLDLAGVTPELYAGYAAQRVIDEVREADIVTKKGTVHPTKLAKLKFRPDFLTYHQISKTELLTGELDTEEGIDER